MNSFIKALYADLLHRIDVVVADIKGIPHHKDIKDRFIDDTLKQFSVIRDELQNALDTGVLPAKVNCQVCLAKCFERISVVFLSITY